MTTRRRFLTGLLSAPAVITTPGLLMSVSAWIEPNGDFLRWGYNQPEFYGDGIHDDTAAVQAALDGKPFISPNGALIRDTNGSLMFRSASIRLTDTIHLGHGTKMDGGFWDGSEMHDRPLFHAQGERG